MADEQTDHQQRLRELSSLQQQRELTSDELREVATHLRAVGRTDEADRAERRATMREQSPPPPVESAPPPPPPQAHTPPMVQPAYAPPQQNGMALASLICAVAGLVVCVTLPIAPILGIIALVQIRKSQGRQSGTGLAVTGIVLPLVVGLFGLILMALMFPVFDKARGQALEASCQSNLKQLALAAMQYAQDYDEIYPSADFETELQPYLYSETVFECPAGGGYAINPDIVRKPLRDVANPAETTLFFETEDGSTPSFPHQGSMNIAWADGHVTEVEEGSAELPPGL